MAVRLRLLLILTGLTGIQGITTVSEVSVKAGGSISIPCLYGSQYRNHVKYLCKGYYFRHCSYVIKTNQQSSGRFLISDDKNQRIFNVTMNDLRNADTDYYWCAVEINGGPDVEKYFHLSVTRDLPRLYVDHQEITGFHGEKITINCSHRNSGEMKWCRLGGSCRSSSGSLDGTSVTINVRPGVVTVTMSELTTDSSGWYLCVQGDLQMPVHLTVTEKPTTTTLATTALLTTTAELVTVTTGFNTPTTVQAELQSASIDLKTLIIPLSLMIVVVMVTLSIWFMLKKLKKTKEAPSAMTTAEEEITYSSIDHMKKTSRQPRHAETDVDVMYSSVVTMRQKRVRKVEAKDENVIYSTLV
ncbi:uncharacterized protein LOC121613684 isoform X2 [Chelmon rostratus]|uniref:uncharacterized protein LOC121613684 isoform X2 n=1 Tax=Chelmon rostratus TaxID=109905 RepID=UPI001BE6CDEA|nr:uncharacterized protein LOC121613684 isoform X2 [Chelmon rostratus]